MKTYIKGNLEVAQYSCVYTTIYLLHNFLDNHNIKHYIHLNQIKINWF